MKFYLKVIDNCEDSAVVQRASKRLVEIFLRPDSKEFKNIIDVKVKAWIKVTKAVSDLKKNKLQFYQIQLR